MKRKLEYSGIVFAAMTVLAVSFIGCQRGLTESSSSSSQTEEAFSSASPVSGSEAPELSSSQASSSQEPDTFDESLYDDTVSLWLSLLDRDGLPADRNVGAGVYLCTGECDGQLDNEDTHRWIGYEYANDEGELRWEDAPAGHWHLIFEILDEHHSVCAREVMDLDVSFLDDRKHYRVLMESQFTPLDFSTIPNRMEIRAETVSGSPASHIQVRCLYPGMRGDFEDSVLVGYTDSDGSLTLPDLVQGEYVLFCGADGAAQQQTVAVSDLSAPVQITMVLPDYETEEERDDSREVSAHPYGALHSALFESGSLGLQALPSQLPKVPEKDTSTGLNALKENRTRLDHFYFRLVDAYGEPLAGATVSFWSCKSGDGCRDPLNGNGSDPLIATTVTDQDGIGVRDSFPLGKAHAAVTVYDSYHRELFTDVFDFEVSATQEGKVQTFCTNLPMPEQISEPESSCIIITISDRGLPMEGIRFSYRREGEEEEWMGTTDSEGKVRLAGLTEGQYYFSYYIDQGHNQSSNRVEVAYQISKAMLRQPVQINLHMTRIPRGIEPPEETEEEQLDTVFSRYCS